ncbi:MAG: glycosyltransferase [Acidobacteria bacterium]|nr:glycosyltransferase [Acidobacteriota bacterium]
MKVLHILDSLNRGGAEMLELDVCRNAAKNGLELAFAATGGGSLEEDFRNSGVRFFRFQRRLPVDPRLVARLRKLIKKHGFDVVHTHQPVAGLHAFLATRGTPVKNVMSFQGFIPDRKNRLITKFLVPRMAANVSCSHGLTEWLAEVDRTDVAGFRMIYNGVDRARLAYDGESLREELKLAPDAFLFGMVAHFYTDRRKDQITLCKAFARVADDLPDAHLILVGRIEPGAEAKYAECRRIVAENGLAARVHFLGQRDDLAKVVKSLDVYVFSSFYEGLPIALMEAMLSKKPCILSDIAPHREVSSDGEFAEVFETENADELAGKLVKLARDADFREDLAGRAYEFAVRTFSIEAHLENLKKLYETILNQ